MQDRIEDKVEKFAEKVHPLFVANNWKWRGEVPTIEEIEGHCHVLISEACKEMAEWRCVSSGRIQVRVTHFGVNPRIQLELVPFYEEGV